MNLFLLFLEIMDQGLEPTRQRLLAESLDAQVFEGRNQEYGAYQLRKNYHWHLFTAAALVWAMFMSLVVQG